MIAAGKQSITDALASVTYVPDRTPASSLDGSADRAFASLGAYRDGAIHVGHYSGSSEWERHRAGDEIVLVLGGSTALVLLVDGVQTRHELAANELLVVPQGTWHRFEDARDLRVLAVTPAPTDHQLALPENG